MRRLKIKSQLLLSIVSFSITLAIIGASLTITAQQNAWLNDQQEIAEKVQICAGDLSYLSNNYFLYERDSDLALWQSTFDTMSSDLPRLHPAASKQLATLNNIKEDMRRLDSAFSGVVSILKRCLEIRV